jgi:hypothetical protein
MRFAHIRFERLAITRNKRSFCTWLVMYAHSVSAACGRSRFSAAAIG